MSEKKEDKKEEPLPRYVETKDMISYESKNGKIVWRRQK